MLRSYCSGVALLLLVLCVAGESVEEAGDTLIFVSVVFRHGNRAPLVHYKTDPHKDKFPDGVGQLTRQGKNNMYHKGVLLRKMYDGFLSRFYSEAEFYCTSTVADRTLMSAQMVLAGLYPPADSYHQVGPGTRWQPVPLHEDSPDKSFIFGHGQACPRYAQVFYERINKTTERLKKETDIEAMLLYCQEHCGESVKTVADLGLLVDALKSEVAEGLQLPGWVREYYDPTLLGYLTILMNVIVETTEQKRLITGPLLKQINDNMAAKVRGELQPDRKVFLYSGHDFSILGLLGSLTRSRQLMPQPAFGASLAFELYRNARGEHIVKVKYLHSFSDETPEDIFVRECGTPCFLDKFLEITQYVIPGDWNKECQAATLDRIERDASISRGSRGRERIYIDTEAW